MNENGNKSEFNKKTKFSFWAVVVLITGVVFIVRPIFTLQANVMNLEERLSTYEGVVINSDDLVNEKLGAFSEKLEEKYVTRRELDLTIKPITEELASMNEKLDTLLELILKLTKFSSL